MRTHERLLLEVSRETAELFAFLGALGKEDREKTSKLDMEELIEKTRLRRGVTSLPFACADLDVKYRPAVMDLINLAIGHERRKKKKLI